MSEPIRRVVLFSNGTVMVFDRLGRQMPELQGEAREVRERILEAADKNTIFDYAVWKAGASTITREKFATLSAFA
ncbi:MAG TPA: hypothetical protein VH022_14340 [Candidatus Acidoferrum sp.]|nr:hypothetical protein [Candidatus Acidoferrum sp.]